MNSVSRKRGFTLVELLVVIAIIGILIGLLLPAIQAVREAARRSTCSNHMSQIAKAVLNFESSQKYLPQGSIYNPSTQIYGYSWFVQILPYIEMDALATDIKNYDKRQTNIDPLKNLPALSVRPDAFTCPTYSGPDYVIPATTDVAPQGGITNYKGLGATSHASLLFAASTNTASLTPPYGPSTPASRNKHPDGVLFPGKAIRLSAARDGTSNTVFATETVEEVNAQWQVGQHACLVGLPPEVQYTRTPPVNQNFNIVVGWIPGKYEEDNPDTSQWKTYLNWDYENAEVGVYDPNSKPEPMQYGPSSRHAAIVNHSFLDGSVRSIVKKVDVTSYFIIITRDNGDPSSEFFNRY